MSDITKRQAYVFLQERDVIQDGDEYLGGDFVWYKSNLIGKPFRTVPFTYIRRPIATPEQTDGLTIEQRVTALESRLNTQPAEQPRETCKWKAVSGLKCSPHNGSFEGESHKYCYTCGLRIEVVE